MAPHRHAELVARCRVCEAAAEGGCQRCGLPLCDRHVPPPGSRCSGCEDVFAQRAALLPEGPPPYPVQTTKIRMGITSAFAVAGGIFGATFGTNLLASAVASVCFALGTFVTTASLTGWMWDQELIWWRRHGQNWLRQRGVRRKFLRERPDQKQLSAGRR